ncbi:RHS repeat domain-containing protein [Aureispira anguillae]|uniref:RHS repeat-associated core domain-containing protein n=1 Tax=Aureispira anguillae TaxID=2864201 RepID=A0A916DRY1_9BACT|nr:RHS repeat-associated core domain-containing protein [Aureispira anguillae]BDS10692.1 hypothetical protein AsAng_0014010 [Aureispira anguillae]
MINDVKSRENINGTIEYTANVIQSSDSYPFGWDIKERSFSTDQYRFSFNGKENDLEWGNQHIQDYGFRLYNPALAKFLSVDPLAPEYPELTPYQFASNRPIDGIDLDGLEYDSKTKYYDIHNHSPALVKAIHGFSGSVGDFRGYTVNFIIKHHIGLKGGFQIAGGLGMFQTGAGLSGSGYGAIVGVPMMLFGSMNMVLGGTNVIHDVAIGSNRSGALTGYSNAGHLMGNQFGEKAGWVGSNLYTTASIVSSFNLSFRAGVFDKGGSPLFLSGAGYARLGTMSGDIRTSFSMFGATINGLILHRNFVSPYINPFLTPPPYYLNEFLNNMGTLGNAIGSMSSNIGSQAREGYNESAKKAINAVNTLSQDFKGAVQEAKNIGKAVNEKVQGEIKDFENQSFRACRPVVNSAKLKINGHPIINYKK